MSSKGDSASTESSKTIYMMRPSVFTELSGSGMKVYIRWRLDETIPIHQPQGYELERDGKVIAKLDKNTYFFTDTVDEPGDHLYTLYSFPDNPDDGKAWVQYLFTVVP
jgi:hypothetical protein